jgi:hypothetical protein
MSENHATVVRAYSLRLQLATKNDIPTVLAILEVATAATRRKGRHRMVPQLSGKGKEKTFE